MVTAQLPQPLVIHVNLLKAQFLTFQECCKYAAKHIEPPFELGRAVLIHALSSLHWFWGFIQQGKAGLGRPVWGVKEGGVHSSAVRAEQNGEEGRPYVGLFHGLRCAQDGGFVSLVFTKGKVNIEYLLYM